MTKHSSWIFLLLTACHVSSPFGTGNSNNSSITDQLCSSSDFGPVPLSIEEGQSSKLFIDRVESSSLLPSHLELMAIVDSACRDKHKRSLFENSIQRTSPKHKPRSRKKQKVSLDAFSFRFKQRMDIQNFETAVNEDPCVKVVQYNIPLEKYVVPNDPDFAVSDHLNSLGMPAAWDIFYGPGGISQDVIFAVVDDGGDTDHPDLAANVWTHPGEIPGNSIDEDGNGYVDDVHGYNFASNTGDPNHEIPEAVHGTKVAGVAAATYNNGIGSTGVMGQHIKIMHLNAAGNQVYINTLAAVNAIVYAANNGADVINLSWGSNGSNPGLRTIIQEAVNAGSFITIAAGNSTLNIDSSTITPAAFGTTINGAITVGSVDSTTGRLSSFSNYGARSVEIVAPGAESSFVGLLTPVPGSNPLTDFDRSFGTSFSAPIVAASAALVIGYLRSNGQNPTPAEIETLLKDSSTTSSSLTGQIQGCRSLNISTLASQL